MENEQEKVQTEQTDMNTNWLDQEQKELEQSKPDMERQPSLKLEENKVTEFDVDFSKPFEKWEDSENNVIKAMIPVIQGGEEKLFWLNTKNPTYRKIIDAGKTGQKTFKIMRTGQNKDTRFILVD